MAAIVQLFGHSAGGRLSERLMTCPGMPVDRSTILRSVKKSARAQSGSAAVGVAGIDDWAWKAGMNYGTVIVDLEQRRVVGLLADRSSVSTAEWLKGHPEIEVVSRDRAGLYADGARSGAPQARQIADRFHLLQNFREAVERQLGRFGAPIRERPSAGVNDGSDPAVNNRRGQRHGSAGAEQQQLAQRSLRADRQALFDRISPLRCRRDNQGNRPEVGSRPPPCRALGAPHRPAGAQCHGSESLHTRISRGLLARRWNEGVTAGRSLFAEIRQRGYTGSYSHLARFSLPGETLQSHSTQRPPSFHSIGP